MARKRVNTNLVAFLTGMGVVVTVAIFLVIVLAKTSHDPVELARRAQESEVRGDREMAARQYLRAYAVHYEGQYAVEAARVLMEMGEIGPAIAKLEEAHTQSPNDTAVLTALVNSFLQLRDYGQFYVAQMEKYADRLLECDPESALGWCAKAAILLAKDPSDPAAEEAIARAAELAPDQARVVRMQAQRAFVAEQLPEDVSQHQRVIEQAQQRALAIVEHALEAHPNDPKLIQAYVTYAATHPYLGLTTLQTPLRKLTEAQQRVEQAIAATPSDPDLRLTLAVLLHQRVRSEADALTEEEKLALLDAARTELQTAVELEPALYEGYMQLAENLLLRKQPESEADRGALYAAVMKIYDDGLEAGLESKSLRRVFSSNARYALLQTAFSRAREMFLASTTQDNKEFALEHAERYVQMCETERNTDVMTHRVRAVLSLLKNDVGRAMDAFTEVLKQTETSDQLQMVQLNIDACMQMAMLYNRSGQTGEAQRYVEEALTKLKTHDITPPVTVLVLKAEIMTRLGQAQEALDLVDSLLRRNPTDDQLLRQRAAALVALDRTDEAEQILGRIDSAPEIALGQAQLAAAKQEWDVAEETLRRAIDEGAPLNRRQMMVDALVNVMLAADREDALKAYLGRLIEQTPDDDWRRWLKSRLLVVSVDDPEKRDAEVLKLIESIPDDAQRLRDLYLYHKRRGEMDQAQRTLDELEQLDPESQQTLLRQFAFALEQGDADRADDYAAKLAELDVDRVQGATYRGRVAMLRREPQQALNEFTYANSQLPRDAELRTMIASAYLAFTPPRLEEARAALEDAVAIRPDHAEANRLLFLVNAAQGMSEDAPEFQEQLATALQLNPGNEQLTAIQSQLNERLNPHEAIARRSQIRQERPTDLANLCRLAKLYLSPEVNDAASAIAVLKEAHAQRLNPSGELNEPSDLLAELYRPLAMLLTQAGATEEAAQTLEEYAASVNGVEKVNAMLALAQLHGLQGAAAEAATGFRDAERIAEDEAASDAEREQLRIDVALARIALAAQTADYDAMLRQSKDLTATLGPDRADLAKSLRLRCAETLLRIADRDGASAEIAAYRKDFPDDPRGRLLEAQLLIGGGDLEGAREQLNAALQQNEEYLPALFLRSGVNMDLRRMAEARADLLALKRLRPNGFNMQHRFRLARSYEMSNQPELALGELREVLDANPQNRDAAVELLGLCERTDRLQDAQREVGALAAKSPNDPFWPRQMGRLLLNSKNYPAAATQYGRAVELTEGRDASVAADWITALVLAGRPQEAMDAYAGLSAEGKNALTLAAVAGASYAVDDKTAGREQLVEAARQAAANSLNALKATGDRAQQTIALPIVTAAFAAAAQDESLAPEAAGRVHLVDAVYYRLLGDVASSAEAIDAALAVVPAQSPERVDALLTKADLIMQTTGEFSDEVRRLYEQAIQIAPNNVLALNNLAYQLATNGAPQEALQYAERLRRTPHNSGVIWDTIGVVLWLNERPEEARSALERAAALAPTSIDAHRHLGGLLRDLGEDADAKRYLSRALELAKASGDDVVAAEIEDELSQIQ